MKSNKKETVIIFSKNKNWREELEYDEDLVECTRK